MGDCDESGGGSAPAGDRDRGSVYETMVDAIDEAVFLVDVDHAGDDYTFTLSQSNEAYRRQTGFSRDQLRGATPRALFGAEQGAEIAATYSHCVETGEPVTYEETLAVPAGTCRWRTRLVPVVEGETVTRLVGTGTDLTGMAERDRELERYEAMLEASKDVVTVIDTDGVITYVSPSVHEVLGYAPEDLVGENGFDFQPDSTAAVVAEAIADVRETPEEPRTVQTKFRHADGSWRWIEATIQNRLDDEVIDGLLVSSRDVTERTEYAERLKIQRDDLDVLNQVLRHDIRNDLQLVVAYAELLADDPDDTRREYAETILESATHAVELTRTAREMASVMLSEADTRRPLDLGTALEAELEDLRATYPEATVRLEGDLDDVSVLADDMLRSVFRNLLKNAVQHNDADVPEVSVSASLGDGTVTVRVADNGPGIDPSRRETIFSKGEKGLGSRGSGLGLYLVQTLVEGYGGEVWVEDGDHDGAVFVVELPTEDGGS
ncbi:PAS domain S-box protein [Halomicroarcula sp. GCM10025817]|uniref:PAS domain S-box protein n=1 Tax=Halomicroarcula sp. GCM10025817 TaxID=3252672 RepID=UPI0036067CBC